MMQFYSISYYFIFYFNFIGHRVFLFPINSRHFPHCHHNIYIHMNLCTHCNEKKMICVCKYTLWRIND